MFRSLRAALMAIAVPGAAAALFITAISWTSYGSLDDTARKTFVAKDVVADILPPPMYLIEMRLVLSQGIEQTIKPAEARKEFDRLVKEYDARVAYWTANPPYGLEAKLLGTQHTTAQQFIALARTQIVDRLIAGDLAGARAAMPAVQAAYHAHRLGVDETVASGNQFADAQAALFDRTGEHGRWTIVGVAAVMFVLMSVMSVLALGSIVRKVKRGVAMAQGIAAGDLSATPQPTANDEFGLLQTAMLRMQDVLRRLIDAQTHLAQEHTDAGRLGARIEVAGFEGSYRTMAEGVNSMVASQVALTDHLVDLVGQYGQGNFAETMEALPGDKARITSAVRSVQDSLKAGAVRAAANLRIRRALDAADTNVMLSDANDQVIYVNHSLQQMFEQVESDLRAEQPGFSAAGVIGSSAGALIASPEHPPTLLARLRATHKTLLKRGPRSFDLTLTPIFDADAQRTGTALEWKDITAELALREAEQRAIAEDLRVAAENLRIKNALDVAEANVMLADAQGSVLYVNHSLARMFAGVEGELRRDLAGFSAAGVIGASASALIASPEHPPTLLAGLRSAHKSRLKRGACTFDLILTPILGADGQRAGTAIEWKDVTAELAAREAELKAARDTRRIKDALDKCSTAVMLAGSGDRIVYLNESLVEMLTRNEAALRRVLPDFDANALNGSPLGPLLRSFGLSDAGIEHLNGPRRDALSIAGLSFELVLAPVRSESGERVGTVVEWADRSAEVAVEQELAQIVDAAAAGDFAKRFGLEGKAPFFQQIGQGINRLLDTTANGLGDVVRVLGALAKGNLTQRIDAAYRGTFGRMKDDANVTVEQLARIIGDIREASETIHSGASEIAAGNQNLSQRTEQQASSLQQTAATIEQLTTTVKQNADSARQANELATTASSVAIKGGNVVSQVVTTMNSITESSKKIVDIISVIDGIAFQTNILALNAAVEAARAGEQGRGFAVVAGEVRSLAQRSASAAKEIKTLIGDSVDKVDTGSRLVDAAGQTMQDIVASVRRVTDIMGEISSASLQQSSGIEQVNQAIAQMDQATQQNAALVEQAAAAAESMRKQAGSLANSVGVFTLS